MASLSRQFAARALSLWPVLPAPFWLHRGAFAQAPPPLTTTFQNCTTTQVATPATINNIGTLAIPASAASAAISAAIGNVSTAFLTQQGSAFVSAPANPAPDQPGGGVWARGVGGQANITSTSNSVGVSTQGGAVINTATTNCNNQQRQTFAGAQVGTDIARLNYAGWNLHLGTTAGYLGSQDHRQRRLRQRFRSPFWGTYFVATKGRFFADLMVRQEFYNINLNNPTLAFSNQPVGAHGWSISASTGYNFDLGQGWFIEPSAGFIYSRISVDSFTAPGVAGADFTGITGVVQTNDVNSQIGRASLRVGKAIATPTVIWQPFASASVFHEFAGDVRSNYTSLNGAVARRALYVQPGRRRPPASAPTASIRSASPGRSSTRAGSASCASTIATATTSTAGPAMPAFATSSRPRPIAAVMPTKAPKSPIPVIGVTNWTGFYVGGFFGAAAGTHRHRVRRRSPQSTNQAVGVRTDRRHPARLQLSVTNNWVLGVEGDIGAADVHGGAAPALDRHCLA